MESKNVFNPEGVFCFLPTVYKKNLIPSTEPDKFVTVLTITSIRNNELVV